jgi:hypothetical protein
MFGSPNARNDNGLCHTPLENLAPKYYSRHLVVRQEFTRSQKETFIFRTTRSILDRRSIS